MQHCIGSPAAVEWACRGRRLQDRRQTLQMTGIVLRKPPGGLARCSARGLTQQRSRELRWEHFLSECS